MERGRKLERARRNPPEDAAEMIGAEDAAEMPAEMVGSEGDTIHSQRDVLESSWRLIQRRQFSAARSLLAPEPGLVPDDPAASNLWGHILLGTGAFAEAHHHFRCLCERRPNSHSLALTPAFPHSKLAR